MAANTTQNPGNDTLKDELARALEQSLAAGDLAVLVALLDNKAEKITIPSTDQDYENLTRLMVVLAEPRPELLMDHPQNQAIRALCQRFIDQLKRPEKKAKRGY